MKQISQTADTWIIEEIPVSPALKIIRENDPWYGMSEEEIEDHEFILQIPIELQEKDFWAPNHQGFQESAFNTHDFQRTLPPFNRYAWRIKKVLEKIRDLAIYHSSTSQPKGKARLQRRYEIVADNEFRDRRPALFQRYQKS